MMSETSLTYQVYVAPIIAMAGKDVPPGQSRSTWSPISATLISGRHDAVLVDPLMTVEQGMAVADWVSTTGKNLTTVYITHGHGDQTADAFAYAAATLADRGDLALALEIITPGLLRHPRSRELAELRQAVLVRLMEQRQLSDPFGFLVYAELAGAELSPIR